MKNFIKGVVLAGALGFGAFSIDSCINIENRRVAEEEALIQAAEKGPIEERTEYLEKAIDNKPEGFAYTVSQMLDWNNYYIIREQKMLLRKLRATGEVDKGKGKSTRFDRVLKQAENFKERIRKNYPGYETCEVNLELAETVVAIEYMTDIGKTVSIVHAMEYEKEREMAGKISVSMNNEFKRAFVIEAIRQEKSTSKKYKTLISGIGGWEAIQYFGENTPENKMGYLISSAKTREQKMAVYKILKKIYANWKESCISRCINSESVKKLVDELGINPDDFVSVLKPCKLKPREGCKDPFGPNKGTYLPAYNF